MTARKQRALEQKIRENYRNISMNGSSVTLIKKFRWLCLDKFGARGIKELVSLFQRLDRSGDGKIDESEFVSGVQSLRLEKLSAKEVKLLFKELDEDNSGYITIKEFNEKMINEIFPSNRRLEVEKLFKNIDYDNSGFIDKADLLKKLNFTANPSFKSGQLTKDECIDQFIESFESEEANNADGKISLEEFLSYYAAISLAVPEDAYFTLELNKNWKNMSTVSERQRSWPASDTFVLDLSKTSSKNIKPTPRMRMDVTPISEKSIYDRKILSARTMKDYQQRESNPGQTGVVRATVVVGNKRSLYRSKAPSYVDRHLFGKPRNQQLMESDWPAFESPFAVKQNADILVESGSSKTLRRSLDSSMPLKWPPSTPGLSTQAIVNKVDTEVSGLGKNLENCGNLRGKSSTKNKTVFARPKSCAEPYRTHKVTLSMPEWPIMSLKT